MVHGLMFIRSAGRATYSVSGVCGIPLFCVGSLSARSVLIMPSGRVRSFVFMVSLGPSNIDLSDRVLAIKRGMGIVGNRLDNVRNRITVRTGGACIIVHVGSLLATDIGIPGSCLGVVK